MTLMNRQCAKTLMRSLDKYEGFKEMVERAVHPTAPSLVKSHFKNRDKFDDSYLEVLHDWKTFMRELDVPDSEDGANNYEYNIDWMAAFKSAYFDLVEKSDEKLENLVIGANEAEDNFKVAADVKEAQDKRLASSLSSQIEVLTDGIEATVAKITSEVKNMEDGGESQARVLLLNNDLHAVNDKMDNLLGSLFNQYVNLLSDHEAKEKEDMRSQFTKSLKAKIDGLHLSLAKKIKEKVPAHTITGSRGEENEKKEQVYLKKLDPPKWNGDPISFADFVRKWRSQVSKANLPPESEMDRLRDNIPVQAAKALYGEDDMQKAWKILDALYGDKDLIASKLKSQLKNMKSKGKFDYDIIIELVTDVNNVVLRLKAIEKEEMLHFDREFLSAVYRVLPASTQMRWLEFDKTLFRSKWAALMKFLDGAREQAVESKVLLADCEQKETDENCRRCGGTGHRAKKCPTASMNAFGVSDGNKDAAKNKEVKLRAECGKCPVCKGMHSFFSNKEQKWWPSDRLFKCEEFRKLSVKDRASMLEKHKCCPICTSWNHNKVECKVNARCSNVVSGQKCGGQHSSLVCGSGNAYCGAVRPWAPLLRSSLLTSALLSSSESSSDDSSDENSSSASNFPDLHAETLLMFQDVKIAGSKSQARVCWDKGSSRCLVTHRFAKSCNMRSDKVVYRLDVVGRAGVPEAGCYYIFEVVKNDGSTRRMWAYGIEEIMNPPELIDLTPVRHLFPHLPDSAFVSLPKKPVDMLIGNNFLGIIPSDGAARDIVGDLRAHHSQFGDGWVLAGTHPALKSDKFALSSSAHNLARIFKCEVVPDALPNFLEGECLGVLPPSRCGKCSRCTECTDPALIRSRKDQDELDILKKSVKLINGQLQVTYPFSRDPRCLPNNRSVVVKMAASQEKRLIKSGHHSYYNSELKKYIDRGAAVKLSKQDLAEWKGPINYISHHGVMRPDSTTTPLRIVTNSSLKNGIRSLNECLIRGPNSLNSMMDIALRFRCHECGMVFDLTKAYNSLKTGPVERNLRRFVWRFSPDDEWEDWAFDCVAFGDLPAANLLEIGRDLTADEGEEIDPVAARKIKVDSYVDDNVSGGSFEEVDRMKGAKLEDGSFSGTVRKILDKGSLKIKTILSTGETDEEVKSLIGNKVLGYKWDATSDLMGVSFSIYLCNKKKKVAPMPALSEDSLQLLESTPLTRRICLGITNGFLDFLGVACPFTIRFKLLMKQLLEGRLVKMEWDDHVPEDFLHPWKELIAEAVKSGSLCFPRCTRPARAIGVPLVVGFADGAFPAFSSATYLQWQVECSHGLLQCDDDYEAALLCAKARVTPLEGFTIPRSELSGVVLESRLCLTTVKALQTEPSMTPKGVIMLTDSKCSISAIDTVSRALKPFFHNRVSEILDNIKQMKSYCIVEDVHYVPTDLNPADLATRGTARIMDIGLGSFWQSGPAFLRCRRGLWPVSRDFVHTTVPDEEVRTQPVFLACLRGHAVTSENISPKVPKLWSAVQEVINFYNSLRKVLSLLARVIRGWGMKSNDQIRNADTLGEPVQRDLEAAEQLLLLSAMPETVSAEKENKLASLCPVKKGKLIVTCGRLGEKNLSKLIGAPYLPILMPTSRAAYLYMVEAHEGEHGDVHNAIVETLARSRLKVWIQKGRNLAKKVCSQCFMCRRRNKVLAGQQMARIKEESVTMCRPFTYVSLDFAGPVKVKGAVNSRAKMKCWIVVYCCRSTKAVDLLATCGYDTQSFLLKHEEFVARHAAPKTIVSDRGTQLVSAGKVLAEKATKSDITPVKWDWTKITRENKVSNWMFVPIGSPHFNGLPEATIKVLKKTLDLALPPGTELSYPELVTLLAKITYTVNSRPLGLTNISPSSQQEDSLQPLTPNMMLLARSSNTSPPLDYSSEDRFCSRLAYVSQVEKEWWDLWIRQVLPTLFSYRRWKVKQKNLEVGELAMLRYPGQVKDDYCLAKVVEVHPGDDGLVRQVTITYRKKNRRESPSVCNSKNMITERVAIHRLHRLHLVDDDVPGDVLGGDHAAQVGKIDE